MNVASLELCRELYELSGWNDIQYGYFDIDGDTHNRIVEYGGEADVAPAYDLGYLLRKLPDRTIVSKYQDNSYRAMGELIGNQVADTPEDAACKLAIELFKQGILTKA